MKHLNLFDSKDAYDLVKNQLAKPNVSLVEDEIIILSASSVEPSPVYEMVDLGLSVKWAKCNVGAEKETDYGMYFKFGDVVGHGAQVCDHNKSTIPTVEVDSDKHLLPAYDAVTKNMGAGYRMPTKEELGELISGTDHAVMTIEGVPGMRYSKKGDASTYIFIPFAGYCDSGPFRDAGSNGYLWSSTIDDDYYAYGLCCLIDGNPCTNYNFRYCGLSVRGVSK